MNPLDDLYRLIAVSSSCSLVPTPNSEFNPSYPNCHFFFYGSSQTPNSLSTPVARTAQTLSENDPTRPANRTRISPTSSGGVRDSLARASTSWSCRSERAFFLRIAIQGGLGRKVFVFARKAKQRAIRLAEKSGERKAEPSEQACGKIC